MIYYGILDHMFDRKFTYLEKSLSAIILILGGLLLWSRHDLSSLTRRPIETASSTVSGTTSMADFATSSMSGSNKQSQIPDTLNRSFEFVGAAKDFYSTSPYGDYAKALYIHLTNGNISISQCNRYGNELISQYEQNFKETNEVLPLMIGYVYLPAKQRCIGYTRGSSLYHDVRKAFEDEII